MAAKIFYIDDSGASETGFIVYGWVSIDIEQWPAALRALLDWRKKLYADTGIPADYELHATKFLPGRSKPSRNLAWNRKKANRGRVVQDALNVFASLPGSETGAVWRHTDARGTAYYLERGLLYENLLADLDDRMTATDDHGILVMDGNGSDPSYQRAHRQLKVAHRRIVEDPWFIGSHTSQPVQAADLLAYTAYQAVLRHPGKSFMWDWWARHFPAASPPRRL